MAWDSEKTPESFGGWQPKGAIAIGHFLKSFKKIHHKLKHHHRVTIVVTKVAI